jgi:hypothetical protein
MELFSKCEVKWAPHGLELIANLRGNITASLNGEVKLTILRKHEN